MGRLHSPSSVLVSNYPGTLLQDQLWSFPVPSTYVPALSAVTLERTLLTENCQQIGRYDLKNNLKKRKEHK